MKLEYQSRCLRLLLEFFPVLPEIRRYRVVPKPLDAPLGRLLCRNIAGQMRQREREEVK